MNIPDPSLITQTPAQTTSDDSTTTSSSDDKKSDKESKSFSKVLAEKKPVVKGADPQLEIAQPAQPPVVQQSKQTAPVTHLSPAMQNLVQEIAVATGPKGSAKVDIQLNSKTFDGLKLTISQTAGNVSIQMLSRTPEVAALLTRNIDQLSQALAARGVPVTELRVQTLSPSARPRSDAQGGNRDRQP